MKIESLVSSSGPAVDLTLTSINFSSFKVGSLVCRYVYSLPDDFVKAMIKYYNGAPPCDNNDFCAI